MIIGIIWVGSHRIDLGYMEVGGLMAFIQYAMHILMSMIMVSMIFIMLPRAAVSADRINEILDTEPESDIMVVEGGIVTVDARDARLR